MTTLTSLSLFGGIALLMWRLWTFTIRPSLYPDEPKELPYWIPCHGWAFFRNYNEALDRARCYFSSNVNVPYSIWVAGRRLYIVNHPTDIARLYCNETTLSFTSMVVKLHQNIGITPRGIDLLFNQSAEPLGDSLSAKTTIGAIVEYHRRQLTPGRTEFKYLMETSIVNCIEKIMNFHDGEEIQHFVREISPEGATVSLLEMCEEIFIIGIPDAWLGMEWFKTDPSAKFSMVQWERVNWKFIYELPAFASQDMIKVKETIISSLEEYFKVPLARRSNVSYFVRSVEAMLLNVGMSERDIARVMMLQFWAITGNLYKLAFWAISLMAYDANLLQSIRAEVLPAVCGATLDENYLAEHCPKLNSLMNEVMRTTIASGMMRDITAPTVIGGKTLKPGHKLLVPYRHLHLDPEVWGEDAPVTDPRRFVHRPKLENSKNYRPFGGGNVLCPGRFFAKRAVAYFIARLVSRYELYLKDPDAQFPRVDLTMPTPGVLLPIEGDDLILALKLRG